ncbi:Arm DNA-binding domain-containing protein [Sphingomonas sp. 22176]|uniref:Arm DNA-binding domain-containing protein n=1 Tax=Sphingomonas sp. 22176 TaxID=3453884 RepID=UPI003F83C6EC
MRLCSPQKSAVFSAVRLVIARLVPSKRNAKWGLFCRITGLEFGMRPHPFGPLLRKAPTMALSDIAIRKAKTGDKAYKLYDKLGLFLLVSPSGSCLWWINYKRHDVKKNSSVSAPSQSSSLDSVGLQSARSTLTPPTRAPANDRRGALR